MSYGGFEYGGDSGGYQSYGGADPMGGMYSGGGNDYNGGFMTQGAENTGGGFTQGGSQQSPSIGQSGGGFRESTLLPVTVKQLLGAAQDEPSDTWRVDGEELHSVRIVGCVINVNEFSTNHTYIIDDCTGRIDARIWVEQGDDGGASQKRAVCSAGTYVRVTGQLKEFEGKIHIQAFDIRPVLDFNEITHHNLEAIYVHCVNTRGPLAANTNAPMGVTAAGVKADPGAMAPMGGMNQQQQQQYGYQGLSMGGAGGMGAGGAGMDGVQSKVLNLFKPTPQTGDIGVNVNEVMAAVKHEGVSSQQVVQAVEYLLAEGHIYSTIDDQHFLSTN